MSYESRLEVSVDSRKGERNLKRFEGQLSQTERRGQQAARTIGNVTAAIKLAGVAAAGLSLKKVISETAGFQDAMLGLKAVSGATAEQMDALSKQARTLGATSMFSAQQAGNAQRFLAQAGLEVNEVLEASPGILDLAAAGQLDLASAADIASNVLGGMRLEVDELGRVNDVMAATAAGANTDISQLGQALSTAAPLAASAGVEIEETAAAIGTLSDAGIQGSRAGTGFAGVLRQLSKVTPQAKETLNEYGLSVADVNIETNGLADVLDKLRRANISTADAFEIFGSEAGAAAQVLVSGSKRVKDFTGDLGDAEGAAKQMANVISSGLTGSLKSFGSMVSETAISLGEDQGVAGGLQGIIDKATGVIAVYNDMLPEFADANDLTDEQARNLELLAGGVTALAVAAGSRLTTALASSAAGFAKNTAASIADAKAQAAAAQAVTRRTGAELASSKAMLSTARLEAAATKGTAAHTFALTQLSAARVRATTAAGAHSQATNVATAAMGRASGAARGLSGAMALVGGPLGLLVGAAGLLYVFRDELRLTADRAKLTEDQISDLRDELSDMSQDDLSSSLSTLNAALDTATLKAATAREELAELRDESRGSGPLGFGGGELGKEVRGMEAVADAKAKIAKIEEKIALARTEVAGRIEDNANAFVVYADRISETESAATISAKGISAATREAANSSDQFARSLQSLQDRLFPMEAAQRSLRSEELLLQQAFTSGRIGIERYLEAYARLQAAQQSDQTPGQAYGGGGEGFGGDIGSGGMMQNGEGEEDYWTKWLEGASTAMTSFDELAGNTADRFASSFGNAFEAMIFDSQSLSDSIYNLADGMSRAIVNALGEMAAQWLAYQAVQLLVGKTTQASAATTQAANASAMSVMAGLNAFAATAAIPIVGPVAAPAAAAAALTATAPMAATVAALSSAGMAHDGIDSVPKDGTWNLQKGERVTTSETSAKLDKTLDDVNRGGNGSNVTINMIEDKSRAGQTKEREGADQQKQIDVFVADIMGDGPRSQAVRNKFGLTPQGR